MSVKYFDKEKNKWIAFPGTVGAPGEDSYDIAVRNGYKGSYEDYVEMISKMPGLIEDMEDVLSGGQGNLVNVEGDITEKHLAVFKDDNTLMDGGVSIDEVIEQIQNGLSGELIDPSQITASIGDVKESNEPMASVSFSNKNFEFSFGLAKGEKGDKGDKGDSGETPISSRVVFAFKTHIPTDEAPAPNVPIGGSWDVLTNDITFPEGWSSSDNIEKPVWMSTGEFFSNDPSNPKWSNPIVISGADGDNGADGVSMEFIYRLTSNHFVIPDRPIVITDKDVAPEGWTDSPSGISEEMQCEWVCTRSYDNGWSEWSEPKIWSKWGANGMDGDGVQYIYYLNNGQPVDNPTIDGYETNPAYQQTGEYKDTEYCPDAPWTDEPSGVTIDNKCEWVSVRKYSNNVWGPYSDPKLWARYGEDGFSGLITRTWYAITENSSIKPEFNKNEQSSPGSAWYSSLDAALADYEYPEAMWSVSAYFDHNGNFAETSYKDKDGNDVKVIGWQGPIIISGTQGRDGVAPNYSIYFYAKTSDSTIKPEKPSNNINVSEVSDPWVDYPNEPGFWWQIIGKVNGYTNEVSEWSEIQPMFGSGSEFRFAVSDSFVNYPEFDSINLNFDIWSKETPVVEENQYLWMTFAYVIEGTTSNWSTPVRISGERGPKGEQGSTGVMGPEGPMGITGVSMEFRYCNGTADSPTGNRHPMPSTSEKDTPDGWYDSTDDIELSGDNLYMWCIQGKKVYDNNGDWSIEWQAAFRISGINGKEKGDQGEAGPIVYPAGYWNDQIEYKISNGLCPYVYLNSNKKFYVLNADYSPIGLNPSSEAANGIWVEIENFEAVYADVGVFRQALVGPAVFHGNYVYSQQCTNGEDYTQGVISDITGELEGVTPNIKFNFADGSGHLAGGNIEWNENGAVKLKNNITFGEGVTISWSAEQQGQVDKAISDAETATIAANTANYNANSAKSIAEEAKLSANSALISTADKISANEVVNALKNDNNIEKSDVIAGILNNSKKIVGTAIADGAISTEQISANYIYSGTLTTGQLNAAGIDASCIKAGTLDAKVIYSGEISADKITSGTLKSKNNDWSISLDGEAEFAKGNVKFKSDGTAQIGNINGGIKINSDGSVEFSSSSGLTEDEVNDLIDTATSSFITENDLGSSGTTNISGNRITTGIIKSSNEAWKLDTSGDGYLAKGNITWDANGTITLKGALITEWESDINNIDAAGGKPSTNLICKSGGELDLSYAGPIWNGVEITVLNNSSTNNLTIIGLSLPSGISSYYIPPKQVARFVNYGGTWYTYREVSSTVEETWSDYKPDGQYIISGQTLACQEVCTIRWSGNSTATRVSNLGKTETINITTREYTYPYDKESQANTSNTVTVYATGTGFNYSQSFKIYYGAWTCGDENN